MAHKRKSPDRYWPSWAELVAQGIFKDEDEMDIEATGSADAPLSASVQRRVPANTTGDGEQARLIQVLVRSLESKTVSIEIRDDAYVADLHNKVAHATSMPAELFKLTHDGKQMEPERTLAHYKVQHQSVIRVTAGLRGGMLPHTPIWSPISPLSPILSPNGLQWMHTRSSLRS